MATIWAPMLSQIMLKNVALRKERAWLYIGWILCCFTIVQFYLGQLKSHQLVPSVEKVDRTFSELIGLGFKFSDQEVDDGTIKFLRDQRRPEEETGSDTNVINMITDNLADNDRVNGGMEGLVVHERDGNAYEVLAPVIFKQNYQILQNRVSVGHELTAITNPNADLIGAGFSAVWAAGIYDYWDQIGDDIGWDSRRYKYNLPNRIEHWKVFSMSVLTSVHQARRGSFENSVHKSAFYIYGLGGGLGCVWLLLEVTYHAFWRKVIRKLTCFQFQIKAIGP